MNDTESTWLNRSSDNQMLLQCPTDPEYFHIPIFIQQILSLILNAIMFIFIISSRRLRHRLSNQIFLNLAGTHVIMAVVLILLRYYPNNYALHIFKIAFLFQTFVSLMATSFDRFVAIMFPYRYQDIRTKHAIYTSLCILVSTLVFYGITYNVNNGALAVLATVLISSICCILLFMNLTIMTIARKHIGQIQKTTNASTISKTRSATACLTLVGAFVILWTPTAVYHILILTGGWSLHYMDCDDFLHISGLLSHMNAILDPFLYVYFRQDTKREIKRCFKKKKSYWAEVSLLSR